MVTPAMTSRADNFGMVIPSEPPELTPAAAVLLLRMLEARRATTEERDPDVEEQSLLAS
jgi:hypothetical protein